MFDIPFSVCSRILSNLHVAIHRMMKSKYKEKKDEEEEIEETVNVVFA